VCVCVCVCVCLIRLCIHDEGALLIVPDSLLRSSRMLQSQSFILP
jgi:hypothetical protein